MPLGIGKLRPSPDDDFILTPFNNEIALAGQQVHKGFQVIRIEGAAVVIQAGSDAFDAQLRRRMISIEFADRFFERRSFKDQTPLPPGGGIRNFIGRLALDGPSTAH